MNTVKAVLWCSDALFEIIGLLARPVNDGEIPLRSISHREEASYTLPKKRICGSVFKACPKTFINQQW